MVGGRAAAAVSAKAAGKSAEKEKHAVWSVAGEAAMDLVEAAGVEKAAQH